MSLENLRRHAYRLAQCGMWMDRLSDVRGLATHLDRKTDFTNEISRMRPDDATANDAVALRIEEQLGEPLVAAVCDGAARGCPGKNRFI
jgi:hypothetical protein